MNNLDALAIFAYGITGLATMALNPAKSHGVITRGESWTGPSTGKCDCCRGFGAFGVAGCECGRTRT